MSDTRRRPSHRPHLTRVLGQPEKFRLSLRGTYFDLNKLDLCQLAEQLTRVLANLAKDEAPAVRVNRNDPDDGADRAKGDPRW